MYILERLLLNWFFIFIFCCFLPIYIKRMVRWNIRKQPIFIAGVALAVLLCMTFPLTLSNDYILDLRLAALLLGGLYSGPRAIIFLYSLTFIARSIFGGLGAIYFPIIAFLHGIFLILFYKKYHRMNLKQKLFSSLWMGALTGLTVLGITYWPFSSFIPIETGLYYILVNMVVTFISIYIIETAEENERIEKKIYRSEKMEVVSHLAASISHEVRNPLTTTRGFLQLLQSMDLEPDKQREFSQIALDELDRAEVIIRDYLLFAKPTDEGIRPFDGMKEIERAIEVIRPMANMQSVAIEATLSPFMLKGNPAHFQQSLLNIMKNAIESMENSGVLTIKATILGDSFVSLSFSDTGV
ncbi:MAG TPA: HAMP domain-containing sensor histidine kinase, partial [Chondromyces sp.]|nr:HAMP domain-containing sensor histidine kinase [Chondromyces sp.]